MIILTLVCFVTYITACTFSFGNDVQHGYCTYYTSQGRDWLVYNNGCFMDCKCKINKTTGVAHMPTRGCLESYPCYDSDGSLTNFSQQYISDNVIGDCYVSNDHGRCTLQCTCKPGFTDYNNGIVIKCGTCANCQCPVNLTTGISKLPTSACSKDYECPNNFLDRINVNNTIACTTNGPNCDLSCVCKSGYNKLNGIECEQCVDCTCPLNLTTSNALVPQRGCNSDDYCKNNGEIETFHGKYEPENVNYCWVTTDGFDGCTLKCNCKPKYTSDGDVLCNTTKVSITKRQSSKMPKSAIAGIIVGVIISCVIIVGNIYYFKTR